MYGRGETACRRISVGESSDEWLIVGLMIEVVWRSDRESFEVDGGYWRQMVRGL